MNKKILIVEDEDMLLKVLSEQFEKSGFDVLTASDGEEALKVLEKSKPDLVLLDIILPKINGFDVLKAMKENPDTLDIPVIIISNLGRDEDIKQAIKLGAVDYYIKVQHPILEIIEKVSKFLDSPKSPLEKPRVITVPIEELKKEEIKEEAKEEIKKPSPKTGKMLKKIIDIAEESAKEAVKKRAEKSAQKPKVAEKPTPAPVPPSMSGSVPTRSQLPKSARKFIRTKKAELRKMNLAPEKYEEEVAKTYQIFSPKEK